jgi:TetR/AcrR family transcriptional regulator, cholesterol catabolism regulator
MPKGIPLSEEEHNRRRHEIYAAALGLFIDQGFGETSMRQIAGAAKAGKSTLYDYFKTKEEILAWGLADEIIDLTAEAKQIAAQPLPALQRLHQVMENHLKFLLARKDFYVKLIFESQRLSMESQRSIQIYRHAYQDVIRRLIDEGIAEGSFRSVDSLVVARTLLNAVTPTVFTSRPSGTSQSMLDEAFDIILRGVQA